MFAIGVKRAFLLWGVAIGNIAGSAVLTAQSTEPNTLMPTTIKCFLCGKELEPYSFVFLYGKYFCSVIESEKWLKNNQPSRKWTVRKRVDLKPLIGEENE